MTSADPLPTAEKDVADDPPGIDPHTHDLPSADDARERIIAFLRWYGDGRIALSGLDDGPPLYARDLEALTRVTPPGEGRG